MCGWGVRAFVFFLKKSFLVFYLISLDNPTVTINDLSIEWNIL